MLIADSTETAVTGTKHRNTREAGASASVPQGAIIRQRKFRKVMTGFEDRGLCRASVSTVPETSSDGPQQHFSRRHFVPQPQYSEWRSASKSAACDTVPVCRIIARNVTAPTVRRNLPIRLAESRIMADMSTCRNRTSNIKLEYALGIFKATFPFRRDQVGRKFRKPRNEKFEILSYRNRIESRFRNFRTVNVFFTAALDARTESRDPNRVADRVGSQVHQPNVEPRDSIKSARRPGLP